MKIGVLTSPWSVRNVAARAFEPLDSLSRMKFKAVFKGSEVFLTAEIRGSEKYFSDYNPVP
jgi:hypothetical protein